MVCCLRVVADCLLLAGRCQLFVACWLLHAVCLFLLIVSCWVLSCVGCCYGADVVCCLLLVVLLFVDGAVASFSFFFF